MLAIELSFPAGRYHATPWNRHVNEGQVEWPPSPWRILRALMAIWYLKARDEIPESDLVALLEQLAGELPRYRLPPSVAAHTRHYMPDSSGKPVKTFDTFLRLSRDARIAIEWPGLQLAAPRRAQLGLLLDRMSYLGRAESLVEARLLDALPDDDERHVVAAVTGTDQPGHQPGHQPMQLLAPMKPETIGIWSQGVLDQRLADKLRAKQARKPGARVKLSAKERDKIAQSVPTCVSDALAIETAAMQKQGWHRPPGSRWVQYHGPRTLIGTTPTPERRPRSRAAPSTARFAVTSKLAPQLIDAVLVAESMRKCLMSRSDGEVVFSGHTNGNVAQGHGHAFILPEANGPGGRITHITVHAEMTFSRPARIALESLVKVHMKRGPFSVALLGWGQRREFAGTDVESGECPLVAEASVWESRTPFVPTRHPNRYRDGRQTQDECVLHIGSPAHDLRRLLRENG